MEPSRSWEFGDQLQVVDDPLHVSITQVELRNLRQNLLMLLDDGEEGADKEQEDGGLTGGNDQGTTAAAAATGKHEIGVQQRQQPQQVGIAEGNS
jgi:hypothetical protein